jgi:hypothetical protein
MTEVNASASAESMSGAARLVETLKPYKELAAILIAAIAGAVTVLEYFATKAEVGIVKCEAQVRVDRTHAELDMLNADRNIERSMALIKTLAQASANSSTLDALNREMEVQKKQWDQASAARAQADARLSACREEGSRK